MSDDWQPGDLALCVNARPIHHALGISMGKGLREGAVYVVAKAAPNPLPGRDGVVLWIVDDPQERWASRFRKIRPHAPDAEDAETIRLLTGKPVREPVA